jgi:hypothetical protein
VRNNSRGFTPVLLILILALVAVVGYFGYKNYRSTIQPIAQPTASVNQPITGKSTLNWKTYINSTSTSNYSLKYPPTWQVSENKILGSGEISDTKWNLSTNNDIPNIRIVVYKSDSSFVKSIASGGTQTVISGETAIKNITKGNTTVVDYRVTNAHTNNTYFIDLEVGSNQDLNQYEPLLNQILSTFQFLYLQ